MTDTFVVTVLAMPESPNADPGMRGKYAISFQAPSGQIEMGYVYVHHIDDSLEGHLVRRIRELYNVGLCLGWRDVYTSPEDDKGRYKGTTCVYEMDFDTLTGSRSGQRLV